MKYDSQNDTYEEWKVIDSVDSVDAGSDSATDFVGFKNTNGKVRSGKFGSNPCLLHL